MDNEIQDSDYVIGDSGSLGGMSYCSQVGEFAEWDDLIDAIKADMEKEQFWPDVWYVNDHGNQEIVCL